MALVRASVLVMAQAPALALATVRALELGPGMDQYKEIMVMGTREETIMFSYVLPLISHYRSDEVRNVVTIMLFSCFSYVSWRQCRVI